MQSRRIRGVEGHAVYPVTGWQICATPPEAASDPASSALAWSPPIEGPASTAAAMLRASGAFSLDGPARRFDAEEWWFKATLPTIESADGDEIVLRFDGIATVSDVWLDGKALLSTDNMFASQRRAIDLTGQKGELVIRCRALDALLRAKRPRPRWKAPMIENQQIRWLRTTLLGRTPGWSPPAAAVGPWGGVFVERRRGVSIEDLAVHTHIEGTKGIVEISCRARSLGGAPLGELAIEIERGGRDAARVYRAPLSKGSEPGTFTGRLEVADVVRWWPHTHGEPALYAACIVAGTTRVDVGNVGFREIAKTGEFDLAVNGLPVFCRGACWTPLDVVSLRSDRAALERALVQARDAGMNMIRVGGTMVYESEDFYDLADELGILLWHDFMFANMDYPEDDASFVENVTNEAREFLGRMGGRPSLAVLCGNSEGEQQAAMFGAPRERWSPKLFHEVLAGIAREACPDVPYWPSSAHGGAFPHEPCVGTTSYYGVGAYLRPLDDARRAEVRFASECLAFANVSEKTPPSWKVHHPAWKARTPRDLGAGWDFDDVRDHYVERLFRVDPLELRYADHDRYLDLGRAATGEVMAAVFGEWRRAASTCRGGLVWFLRDLWDGAGWGVVDAGGAPKAAYCYLRRALAPIAVHVTDEGNNGLYVHLVNDGPKHIEATLELALYRAGEIATGSATRDLVIEPHAALSLAAASCFEGFLDLSFAFRFGPPVCDLVVATLWERGGGGAAIANAFHFPVGLPRDREIDIGLAASARARPDGAFEVTVTTRRFAQSVAFEADGFSFSDSWFHLAPTRSHVVVATPERAGAALKGHVKALNLLNPNKIALV